MKIFFMFLLIILVFPIMGADQAGIIELKEGLNEINTTSYFPPIWVEDLIANNPSIQSITLKDSLGDIGYVNIFGGIGTNFMFESNKSYEISVKENSTIYILDY